MEVHDRLVVDEVDLAPDDRVHDLAQGGCGAPDRREVAAHFERPLGDARWRWVDEHGLLDVVEAFVDHVGHVEVAVDEHVEDRPQEEALFGGAVLRALELEATGHLFEIDLGSAVGRVPHGQQPARAGDDVDLPAADDTLRALAVVHGDVEVVAVAHELGALARVEDGVDDGGAHAERRLQLVQAVLVLGALGVDPHDGMVGVGLPVQVVDRDLVAPGLPDDVAPHADHRRGAYARLRREACTDGLHRRPAPGGSERCRAI